MSADVVMPETPEYYIKYIDTYITMSGDQKDSYEAMVSSAVKTRITPTTFEKMKKWLTHPALCNKNIEGCKLEFIIGLIDQICRGSEKKIAVLGPYSKTLSYIASKYEANIIEKDSTKRRNRAVSDIIGCLDTTEVDALFSRHKILEDKEIKRNNWIVCVNTLVKPQGINLSCVDIVIDTNNSYSPLFENDIKQKYHMLEKKNLIVFELSVKDSIDEITTMMNEMDEELSVDQELLVYSKCVKSDIFVYGYTGRLVEISEKQLIDTYLCFQQNEVTRQVVLDINGKVKCVVQDFEKKYVLSPDILEGNLEDFIKPKGATKRGPKRKGSVTYENEEEGKNTIQTEEHKMEEKDSDIEHSENEKDNKLDVEQSVGQATAMEIEITKEQREEQRDYREQEKTGAPLKMEEDEMTLTNNTNATPPFQENQMIDKIEEEKCIKKQFKTKDQVDTNSIEIDKETVANLSTSKQSNKSPKLNENDEKIEIVHTKGVQSNIKILPLFSPISTSRGAVKKTQKSENKSVGQENEDEEVQDSPDDMNSNSNSNTSKNTINNTIKTENVIKAAIGSVLFPPKPTDGSEEIGHIPTTKVEEPQQLKTPEKSHSHKEEKSDGNGEASEKPVERTKRKYVRRNPRKNMKKKDDGSEVSDKTEKSLKDHLNHSKRSERKDKTSERNKTSDFYNPVEGNCGVNEMIEKTAGVNIHVENTPMGEYPYQHPQVCDPTQFYGINPYAQYQCYPQMMTSDQPQKPITLNLSESDVNVINQINQNTQFGQFQNIPENFRQMPILQPIIVQSQMQFQNYQNYPGCPIYTTFTQETGEKVQETSNDEGGKKKRTKKKKAEKDEKSGKKGGMLKPPMPTPLDTEKTKKSFQVLSKNLPSVLTEDAMIKTQKSISKDGAVEEDKCITERTETDDVENVQKTPQVALEGQQVQTQMQTVFTPVTLPPQFANLSLQTVNTFNQNISTNYSPNGCQLQGQVNSRQIVQNINNHTINTNTNRTVTPLNTTNQINRHTTPKSVATDKIKSLVKNGVAVMFGTLETIADDYKCQLYDIQTVQVKFAPLFPMNRNTPSDLEKNQFVTFLKTVEFANADLVVFCDEFGFQIENEQIVQAYPILGGIQVTRESRVSPILLGISRSGSVLREMCSCTQACAEQLNMIYRNVLYEVQFSFGLTKSGFSMWCQNVYYPYLNQQRQLIEKRVADKALDVFDETLMNKKKAILVLPECYIDFVNEDEMERNNVEVCYFSESVANFLFPTRKVFWEIQKKIYYSNNFRKESVCFMALQVIERLRNQIDERARQIALENAQTSPGKVIENYNEKSNEGVEHQDVLQGNVQSLEVKDCVENEKVGLCGTLEVQEKKINSEMEPFEIVCGDNLVTELTELSEKRVEHLKMTFGEPEETFEFDISSFPIGINLMCKDIVKTKGFKKLKSLVEVMAYFFENFQTIAPFINQVIAQYEQNKETPGFSA